MAGDQEHTEEIKQDGINRKPHELIVYSPMCSALVLIHGQFRRGVKRGRNNAKVAVKNVLPKHETGRSALLQVLNII